ncbi:LysM peptidoglycan-binding domain-containing protein [Streptococcus suis]|nr:LysM peptidoglycan-binding domain-containing protein [Streptococcus suis]NQP59768.1 LysM peptidoglycan-binding domain-containing protein [Streptococcus suis]
MSQEPWNEEVYSSRSVSRKDRIKNGVASTRVFTVLAIIFFIIMLLVLILAIYLSTGGSKTNSNQEFYNASNASSASSVIASSSSATEESTMVAESSEETVTTTTEETTASTTTDTGDGSTLTVEAGEGVASIAARAGISISELERLNPDKMVGPGGTWWANPGDIVRIR